MEIQKEPLSNWCIHCWSGPRCCSTSLMYSWAQRSDTCVLDEPLYASYLSITGLPRPYRDKVLEMYENDASKVWKDVINGSRAKKVLYCKHISKQKLGLNSETFRQGKHVILVREPYGVLQSFSKVAEPTQQELGFAALLEIVSELRAASRPIILILYQDLIRQPEGTLRALCSALDLPFEQQMLTWPAGPKPYDGCWAPWWYANTHSSTGFTTDTLVLESPKTPLPAHLRPLLGECWVMYDLLRSHALTPQECWVARSLMPSAGCSPASAAGADKEETSTKPKSGTHVYKADPRNEHIIIGIRNGMTKTFDLVYRPQAKVSVLDSAFMLGDGVWEGIRIHRGVPLFLEEHLDRLWEGAAALDMDLDINRQGLTDLLQDTLVVNGMAGDSGIHVRLMVSRGLKPTPYQNPATTLGSPTIVIIPEYKAASTGPRETGIRLATSHVRRGTADVQDPSWNSHSKLNCIAACIQANKFGVDEALMLDPHGFVATCNSTNFFIVRKGMVWAPTTKYQLHGITRSNVIKLCKDNGIPVQELDFSLTKVYSADEAFVTGTFAGLIPVVQVDGRMIGSGTRGPITLQLQELYVQMVEMYAENNGPAKHTSESLGDN